jgi:2-oxoisovalerate dehydrogenase E2 component (dihydrolipoyl transacylase)
MALKSFTLPDAGEGLTEADILKWLVAPGDAVVVNQIIVEIETAKAAVELPSPFAGTVAELLVGEGDTVEVGRPIITIDVAGEDSRSASAVPPVPVPARQSVLVGYGPRADAAPTRRRRVKSSGGDVAGPKAIDVRPAPPVLTEAALANPVLAKPPVRKLAKSLGVDLAVIAPTGPNGTISREDVEGATAPAGADGHPSPGAAQPDAQPRETRIPIKGVRQHTAAAVVGSAFTAPHVTVFLTADVTPMMELRQRIAARPEFHEVKVSPLLLVARAVILAAARTPEINASWDERAGEIVLKHYVNLGIAAATERGLVVPNIKDADRMSLLQLAEALGRLTETARAGRSSPADMSAGTITITNIGVFGVDTGTPILNPGESGIVAFGAVRKLPWVVEDQIVPRWVTQLSVSFDHRVVDGQQGSRFLADVAAVLSDPGLALL